MFGNSLLVAPKVWPYVDAYAVTLPKGDWYEYWTGNRLEGGKTIKVDPPLDTLPVYVRAGSILTQQPLTQYVGEAPRGPLELRVYPGPQCGGDLYMDDGNTLAYQKGASLKMHFTCTAEPASIQVDMSAPQGPYQPWFKDFQVSIYGLTGKASSVELDGKTVSSWKQNQGVVAISGITRTASPHTLRLNLVAAK